ncbi:uncharacterized protein CXQ87_002138 [Candidozyma duobushaemuli]|nr:uncharacterized protein CXQ87_002138 [[Candida] duobushaemulonis]PVH14015.1 hypothetical protein CXQ87_002138 [[Candida] duobushaemulonis]
MEDRVAQLEHEFMSHLNMFQSSYDKILADHFKILLCENHCKELHDATEDSAALIANMLSILLSLLTIPVAIYWAGGRRGKPAVFGSLTIAAAICSTIFQVEDELISMRTYIVSSTSEALLPFFIVLFATTFKNP